MEICRNINTLAFQVQFLGAQKRCSASVLSDSNQRQVFWKIRKVSKVFIRVAGVYFL